MHLRGNMDSTLSRQNINSEQGNNYRHIMESLSPIIVIVIGGAVLPYFFHCCWVDTSWLLSRDRQNTTGSVSVCLIMGRRELMKGGE